MYIIYSIYGDGSSSVGRAHARVLGALNKYSSRYARVCKICSARLYMRASNLVLNPYIGKYIETARHEGRLYIDA